MSTDLGRCGREELIARIGELEGLIVRRQAQYIAATVDVLKEAEREYAGRIQALEADLSSTRAELDRLRSGEEYQAKHDNLKRVQARCSELLDVTRAQRWFTTDVDRERTIPILEAVLAERYRQDLKWGPIGPKDLSRPDGTGGANARMYESLAKERCERAMAAGEVTWEMILDEEKAESAAESDPVKLRAELVQTAAVCVKWIEAIDLREAAK